VSALRLFVHIVSEGHNRARRGAWVPGLAVVLSGRFRIDPFRGGVPVLINGPQGVERAVLFALDEDAAVITQRVRETIVRAPLCITAGVRSQPYQNRIKT
jgi:hypothetical protein